MFHSKQTGITNCTFRMQSLPGGELGREVCVLKDLDFCSTEGSQCFGMPSRKSLSVFLALSLPHQTRKQYNQMGTIMLISQRHAKSDNT